MINAGWSVDLPVDDGIKCGDCREYPEDCTCQPVLFGARGSVHHEPRTVHEFLAQQFNYQSGVFRR